MKKWAIIYSSVTGNTKKIADAMAEALEGNVDVFRVQDAPQKLDNYEVVLLGYWLRLGAPDPRMLKYLPMVHDARVCFFQTHGTDPTSEHAITSFARAGYQLGKGSRHIRLPRQDQPEPLGASQERGSGRPAWRPAEPRALEARFDASRRRRCRGSEGIRPCHAAQAPAQAEVPGREAGKDGSGNGGSKAGGKNRIKRFPFRIGDKVAGFWIVPSCFFFYTIDIEIF